MMCNMRGMISLVAARMPPHVCGIRVNWALPAVGSDGQGEIETVRLSM